MFLFVCGRSAGQSILWISTKASGAWGEIQFDFEKRKAKIIQLADWDTSRTKLYAKKVIDHIWRTDGNDLPKKERIIFER